MASITPLAYSYVLNLLPHADKDGLALMAATRTQVEFEGYDPGVILALMEQRATAAACDLNEDVLKIVVISIERGNNLDINHLSPHCALKIVHYKQNILILLLSYLLLECKCMFRLVERKTGGTTNLGSCVVNISKLFA